MVSSGCAIVFTGWLQPAPSRRRCPSVGLEGAMRGPHRGRRRSWFCACVALLVLAAGTSSADARFGLLAHYEFCQGGTWMRFTDIVVKPSTGEIWAMGGRSGLSLIHASTSGALLGINDGSRLPRGTPFGNDAEVTVSTSGVYVADNEDPIGGGRLMKFSFGRTPAFLKHFTNSFGRSGWGGVANLSTDLIFLYVTRGDERSDYIAVLHGGLLSTYLDDGTVGPWLTAFPSETQWSDRAAGVALTGDEGRYVAVSDPDRGVVREYVIDYLPPGQGAPFRLVHYRDLHLTLGPLSSTADGTFWSLASGRLTDELVHYSDSGALLGKFDVGRANGVWATRRDVWITRRDGILRLGQGGEPIPPVQNFAPHVCGAPMISRSVPSRQDILHTGRLEIRTGTNEPARLQLSGTLMVPRAGSGTTTFRLKPSSRRFNRAGRAVMTLGLSQPAVNALSAAVRRHQQALARILVVATDSGGAVRRWNGVLRLG